MAITFVAASTLQAGTTSMNMPVPTGATTLDLDIIFVVNKLSTTLPVTPTGYTPLIQQAVGTGANGSNTGPILISVWYRILTAAGAIVPISVPSGNVILGGRNVWRKATTDPPWNPLATYGEDLVSNTAFSALMNADLGIISGEHFLTIAAVTSAATITTRNNTAPGLTKTQTQVESSNQSATGNHFSEWTDRYAVTAGTSTGPATVTATSSVATTGGAVQIAISTRASGAAPSQGYWGVKL